VRNSFDQIPTSELRDIQAESLEYVVDLAKRQVDDVELGRAFRKLVESKSVLEAFGEMAKNDSELADRRGGQIEIAHEEVAAVSGYEAKLTAFAQYEQGSEAEGVAVKLIGSSRPRI